MSFKTKYPHIAYHVGDTAAEELSHHSAQMEGCTESEVISHNRVCLHSPLCVRYKNPVFASELLAMEEALKIVEGQVGRAVARFRLGSKFSTPLVESVQNAKALSEQEQDVKAYDAAFLDAHSELCVAATVGAFGKLTDLEYDTGVGKGASGPGKNIDVRGEIEGSICNFEVTRRIDNWLSEFDGEDVQLSTGVYVRSTGAKTRSTLSQGQREALERGGKQLAREPEYDGDKPSHMAIASKIVEKGSKFPDGKERNVVVITNYGGLTDGAGVQDAVYGSLIWKLDKATGESNWVTSPGGLFHDASLSQVWAVLYLNAYGYLEGIQRRIGGEASEESRNRLFINGYSAFGKDWAFAEKLAKIFDAKLIRATSQSFGTG